MAKDVDKILLIKEFSIGYEMVKPNREVYVVKPEDIKGVFQKLISVFGYESFYLSTLVGTDIRDAGKIRIDYYVVLLPEEKTIVIRTFIPRENPVIDSLVDIIPGALSGECETHDMLGVVFNGNPFIKSAFFKPSELAEKNIFPLRKDSGV
ncbi:MAG: NADH-quinone oxidoreductase subunit C [Desulfurococcaceae archaeon]